MAAGLQAGARLTDQRLQIAFRAVAVAAVVAAFGQVTLGGVVRVTESGLGCPDWPLCYGQIIPPFSVPTMIEYSHRLSASVLSVFVAATAALAWVGFRDRDGDGDSKHLGGNGAIVVRSSIAALVLVVVAALLGGATVLTELAWWWRLFHLSIAELLLACLMVAVITGWNGRVAVSSGTLGTPASQTGGKLTRNLIIAALIGVFALILSGSYMVGYGAGTSCGTWPLCRGTLFGEGAMAYVIHMAHRYIAAIVGLVILAAAAQVIRSLPDNGPARMAAMALIVGFVVQILVGAVVIWTAFGADYKALHLSVATLVWAATVAMAILAFLPVRSEATARDSGLSGATSTISASPIRVGLAPEDRRPR